MANGEEDEVATEDINAVDKLEREGKTAYRNSGGESLGMKGRIPIQAGFEVNNSALSLISAP